jgi:hypothetical protein
MSDESPVVAPVHNPAEKAVILPPAETQGPPHAVPTPDPEQVRAVEAVFAAKRRESETVSGLMGLWAGTMLLNDMAAEHFGEPAGEVEVEEEKPKDEE